MYYHVGLPQDYIELTHLPAYLPPSMIPRLRLLSGWVYYVFGLCFGDICAPNTTIFSLASQCTYIPSHVKWLYIVLWTSTLLTTRNRNIMSRLRDSARVRYTYPR